MTQYCRYCISLAYGNGTWCSKHKKEMSDSAAKRVNHCKDFGFCEIDAFGENLDGYHPREPCPDAARWADGGQARGSEWGRESHERSSQWTITIL